MATALGDLGITLSVRQARRYLGRMGARWRRVQRTLAHKQDPVRVATANRTLDALKKGAAQDGFTLVYLDECGFSPSQALSSSWAAAGQRRTVPYENPQRRRVNVLAA